MRSNRATNKIPRVPATNKPTVVSTGVQYSAAKLAALLHNNDSDTTSTAANNTHHINVSHTQQYQQSALQVIVPPLYKSQQSVNGSHGTVSNNGHNILHQAAANPSNHYSNQGHEYTNHHKSVNETQQYDTDVLTTHRLNSPIGVSSYVPSTMTSHINPHTDSSVPSTAHVRRAPHTAEQTIQDHVSPIKQSFRSEYIDPHSYAEKLRKQAELRESLAQQIAAKNAYKQQHQHDDDATPYTAASRRADIQPNDFIATPQTSIQSTAVLPVSPIMSNQPALSENRCRQMSSTIFGGGVSQQETAAHQRAQAQADLRAQIEAQKREKQLQKQHEIEEDRKINAKIELDRITIANQYNQTYVPSNDIQNQLDINENGIDNATSYNDDTVYNYTNAHHHTDRTDITNNSPPIHNHTPHPQSTSYAPQKQFTLDPTTYYSMDDRPNTSLIKQQFEQYQQQLTQYDQHVPPPSQSPYQYNDNNGYASIHNNQQTTQQHNVISTDKYTQLQSQYTDMDTSPYQYAYDDVNSLTLQRSTQPVRARRNTLQPKKAKPIPPTAAELRAIEIEKRKKKGEQAVAANKKLSTAALQRHKQIIQEQSNTTINTQYKRHNDQTRYPRAQSSGKPLHADSSFVPIDDAEYDHEFDRDDLDHIIQQYSATHIRPNTNILYTR